MVADECWKCRRADDLTPVAYKETPTRFLFLLCDECWSVLGEAFVRLDPHDLCAVRTCRRYLPGLQAWMSAKGHQAGLYCSQACVEQA